MDLQFNSVETLANAAGTSPMQARGNIVAAPGTLPDSGEGTCTRSGRFVQVNKTARNHMNEIWILSSNGLQFLFQQKFFPCGLTGNSFMHAFDPAKIHMKNNCSVA
jgi:hypothetical protein